MVRAILSRFDRGDQGTFGRIFVPGLTLFTGELPWRNNVASVSCIPPGPDSDSVVYRVEWTWSPRFRRMMYALLGTDPRAGIRKHPANLMGDASRGLRCQLNGCIALGEKLGWIEGQKALLLSAPAVRRFEYYMERKSFELEVRNDY